jgi:hypothetical protein
MPPNGAADEPPAGRPLADWMLNDCPQPALVSRQQQPGQQRSVGPVGSIAPRASIARTRALPCSMMQSVSSGSAIWGHLSHSSESAAGWATAPPTVTCCPPSHSPTTAATRFLPPFAGSFSCRLTRQLIGRRMLEPGNEIRHSEVVSTTVKGSQNQRPHSFVGSQFET